MMKRLTLCLSVMVLVFAVSVRAQGNRERAPREGGGPPDRAQMQLFGTMMRLQRMGVDGLQDGNPIVTEEELEEGLMKLQEQSEKARGILLKAFDEDKDGAFNDAEKKAITEFVDILTSLRWMGLDRNQDFVLDDDEMGRIWTETLEQCREHRQGLLDNFDRDKDGELNEDEAAKAREQVLEMRERMERMQRGMQRGGGGPQPQRPRR